MGPVPSHLHISHLINRGSFGLPSRVDTLQYEQRYKQYGTGREAKEEGNVTALDSSSEEIVFE